MKKPRGEAVLKNLPDKLQEELWEVARRNTYAKAILWLKAKHDITISEGPLSKWFGWYPRSLTLRMAAETSSQLEATLAKIPELKITADQARQVAEISFDIQAAQDRDPKLFAMLTKGRLAAAQLRLEQEKHEWAKMSDVEKGLDALHAEIKGNAQALQLFEQLKAVMSGGKGAGKS